MIAGVDHLALSCGALESGITALEMSGYVARFIDRSVPNDEAKRPFLADYQRVHDVAHFVKEGSIAIELTGHGPLRAGPPAAFEVAFSAPPAGTVVPDRHRPAGSLPWRAALGLNDPRRRCWPDLAADMWSPDTPGDPLVRAVLVPVADVEAGLRFWTAGLGCRLIRRDGDRWAHLEFAAPLRSWSVDVALVSAREQQEHHIDDPGFAALAFLSTDVDQDLERLASSGASVVGQAFSSTIAGRPIRVGFAMGPSREPIELVQVLRRAS